MDEHFKKLQADGKNSVDSLVKWMEESKIIDNTKEAEAKARKLFEDTRDKNDVELDKFKEVLKKLAVQNKKSFEQFTAKLEEAIPKLQRAMVDAARAFHDSLSKK